MIYRQIVKREIWSTRAKRNLSPFLFTLSLRTDAWIYGRV